MTAPLCGPQTVTVITDYIARYGDFGRFQRRVPIELKHLAPAIPSNSRPKSNALTPPPGTSARELDLGIVQAGERIVREFEGPEVMSATVVKAAALDSWTAPELPKSRSRPAAR